MRSLGQPNAAYAGDRGAAEPETRAACSKSRRAGVDLRGQSISAHDRLYLAELLPTLIVWGEKDHIIPVAHAHRAHEAMPGSELALFEHSGHFPHVEEPQRFLHVLEDFFERNPPMHLDAADWQERLTHGHAVS